MKKGVQGDRKAFLTGLLTDVFFDAKRPSTVPVTQSIINSAVALPMQAECGGDGRLYRRVQQDRLPA